MPTRLTLAFIGVIRDYSVNSFALRHILAQLLCRGPVSDQHKPSEKPPITPQHARQPGQTIQQTRRLIFLAAIPIVIVLGLASRSVAADTLSDFVAQYSGDMLWALLVYCVFGFTWPSWPARKRVAASLVFAFLKMVVTLSALSAAFFVEDRTGMSVRRVHQAGLWHLSGPLCQSLR